MSEDNARELEKAIRSINNLLKQGNKCILVDHKLTPPQFFALLNIMHHDCLSISELGDRMFLSPPTMTGIVDRLEGKQLVKRERDNTDRRITRLHLTSRGREVLHQVYENRIALMEQGLRCLDDEQRARLADLLNSVRQTLVKAVRNEDFSACEE